ncbi:MAG: cation:proton antiporter [Candidatus Micrarchaeia archaeon]
MRISDFFREGPQAFLLALGLVLLSTALLSVGLHYLFGWEWVTGAILGAIVGGTSSPIIIPIIEASGARRELKDLASLESIATDVLCIVVAIALIGVALGNGTQENFFANITRQIFTAFSRGMVVGIIGALLWLFIIKRGGRTSVDYILTLGFIFITYYISQMLGGNDAITALAFGLVIGNIWYLSQKLGNDQFNIDSIPIKQFHEEIPFS